MLWLAWSVSILFFVDVSTRGQSGKGDGLPASCMGLSGLGWFSKITRGKVLRHPQWGQLSLPSTHNSHSNTQIYHVNWKINRKQKTTNKKTQPALSACEALGNALRLSIFCKHANLAETCWWASMRKGGEREDGQVLRKCLLGSGAVYMNSRKWSRCRLPWTMNGKPWLDSWSSSSTWFLPQVPRWSCTTAGWGAAGSHWLVQDTWVTSVSHCWWSHLQTDAGTQEDGSELTAKPS